MSPLLGIEGTQVAQMGFYFCLDKERGDGAGGTLGELGNPPLRPVSQSKYGTMTATQKRKTPFQKEGGNPPFLPKGGMEKPSLFMEQLLALVAGLAGKVHPQLAESVAIHPGKNHGGVCLASPEVGKLAHGKLRRGVGGRADGKGDQHLIRVQAGVVVDRWFTFKS